jgi:DNA processing protein
MTLTQQLLLLPRSPSWPLEFRELPAAPERLWIRGNLELLAPRPRVAIVGTRAPTPYGEAQAARFASVLASQGVVIVSGWARGIDQCAHAAALRVGGTSIAVLGNGVARPWPAAVIEPQMLESGLFVSEHEPEESPRPHHFPLRNRLISALSACVVVIEAAHASGSLITARWAADQGREVYALPGRVDHPMARGAHKLLREGAKLVEDPEEILIDLGLCADGTRAEAVPEEQRSAVVRALLGETLSAEELAVRLDAPLTQVLVELVEAEMRGEVVRTAGGRYRRVDQTGA